VCPQPHVGHIWVWRCIKYNHAGCQDIPECYITKRGCEPKLLDKQQAACQTSVRLHEERAIFVDQSVVSMSRLRGSWQGLRLLLCRGIEARLGTDGKRRPGTIALDLGLAYPPSFTLKRDRPFIGLHHSSCCCLTPLMDVSTLRHVRGPPIIITSAIDSRPRSLADVSAHSPLLSPSLQRGML
jgi:hypothetical protein